ncbi:MAG TPA: aldehyde dehydrogenase family protein [Actinomycetaceae bacterium]|nr:aldehyde dehydrogenase family protein [Actinomycetaceae bacterium]
MAVQKLHINGEWVSAAGGTLSAYNPATEEVIAEFGFGNAADVDAAVASAAAALRDPAWRDMAPAARARLLFQLADLMQEHTEEFAELETLNQGQPLAMSRGAVASAAEHLRYFAGWITKIHGVTSPIAFPNTHQYTRREPMGVCALITPWNLPLGILCWKVAPALATGNTIIIKPAEQTPLTAIKLVELAEQIGFPRGVINLVTGDGTTGQALVDHPGVNKVSFTGSTEVGRKIVAGSAASNLKRVTLELGGKAPSIIAADADMDAAVAGNLAGSTFNNGQICAAYTRFYVDKSRHDEFVDKMAAGLKNLTIGSGMDPDTNLGPLVSAEHLANVSALVDSGVSEGAELVMGGGRAAERGYFFEPTMFTGVTDEMSIAQQEIFGPVLSVMAYDGAEELDDVIERANSTEYGLASTVWTKDMATAHRVANGLQAGMVFVNMPPAPDMTAPWGGYKMSGWGNEMGPYAIDAYTQIKGVWMHYG